MEGREPCMSMAATHCVVVNALVHLRSMYITYFHVSKSLDADPK